MLTEEQLEKMRNGTAGLFIYLGVYLLRKRSPEVQMLSALVAGGVGFCFAQKLCESIVAKQNLQTLRTNPLLNTIPLEKQRHMRRT